MFKVLARKNKTKEWQTVAVFKTRNQARAFVQRQDPWNLYRIRDTRKEAKT